jgi:polysaccharide biosynthesis/export protein
MERNSMLVKAQRISCTVTALGVVGALGGCKFDNFVDPSKQGYFEHQPTTLPILTKIDVIEPNAAVTAEYTSPTPEDLLPNTLVHTFGPGDFIRIEVYELLVPRQMWTDTVRVDPSGQIRLPQIGNLDVLGMTSQEVEDAISDRIRSYVLNPTVGVTPEESRAFQYTLYGLEGGSRQSTGVYNLVRPDFRLLEALAVAGGVPRTTRYIYIIRHILLDKSLEVPRTPTPNLTPTTAPTTGVDVEDLIDQLNEGEQTPPPVFPTMLADDPAIDVDDLEPVRISDKPFDRQNIRKAPTAQPASDGAASYIYDPQQDRWIRTETRSAVPGAPAPTAAPALAPAPATGDPAAPVDVDFANAEAPGQPDAGSPYVTRIIRIPYDRLANGDPKMNIVVRPGDYIQVEQPQVGVVYIEGEVARPGVYQLPFNDRLTLSRLIAAAGGFGPIAIPERVDLIRIVGPDREAAITFDVAAIRHRTEPDIYLKPNDHIIVGTNFWALPLAVIRNGFRATYGWGFLLDRNFGNDVFGAPPTNQFGQ